MYSNTSDLPFQSVLSGWSPPCQFYDTIVQQYQLSFVVEVGVWKGKSAACLADALRKAGGGALIAVDTWLGALEFWTRSQSRGKRDSSRDLFFHHGYPQVYLHFLANIVKANLQDYVIPFPVPSRLAHDFLAQLQAQEQKRNKSYAAFLPKSVKKRHTENVQHDKTLAQIVLDYNGGECSLEHLPLGPFPSCPFRNIFLFTDDMLTQSTTQHAAEQLVEDRQNRNGQIIAG